MREKELSILNNKRYGRHDFFQSWRVHAAEFFGEASRIDASDL